MKEKPNKKTMNMIDERIALNWEESAQRGLALSIEWCLQVNAHCQTQVYPYLPGFLCHRLK